MRRIAGAVAAAAPRRAAGQASTRRRSQPNVDGEAGRPIIRRHSRKKGRRRSSARRCRRAQAGDDAARPARDAAIPLAERIAIQFDLAWTGDYNGLINGEFNDKTIAAIKTFQRDRKFKETGILNPQERALLAAAAKAKAGPGRLEDGRRPRQRRAYRPADQAGAEQEPEPQRHPLGLGARAGSDRDVQDQGAGTTLAAVYEQQKKEPLDAQARGQPAASGFLHPVGHAEPEEVLRARRDQGRRSARHDHRSTTRRWSPSWIPSWS